MEGKRIILSDWLSNSKKISKRYIKKTTFCIEYQYNKKYFYIISKKCSLFFYIYKQVCLIKDYDYKVFKNNNKRTGYSHST